MTLLILVVGWRWIFLMEGIITVVVSLASIFIVVPFPEDNNSFSPEERAVILARVQEDRVEEVEGEGPAWKRTLAACSDRKVILA